MVEAAAAVVEVDAVVAVAVEVDAVVAVEDMSGSSPGTSLKPLQTGGQNLK